MNTKHLRGLIVSLLVTIFVMVNYNVRAAPTSETPAGSWRPFSDDSPWNTNIEDAPLQTAGTLRGFTTHDSDTYIQFLDEVAVMSTINIARWSIPVYFIDNTTPRVTVEFTNEFPYHPYFLDSMNPVPIPFNAVSDHGATGHYPPILSDIVPDLGFADAHLCIIDLSTGLEYGFWHMAKDAFGTWRASTGGIISISGNGVFTETDLLTNNFARGTAVPLSAGLIWRNDVAAGEIRHALAVSLPALRNQRDFYVWPGLETDGFSSDTRALPEGARLRLKWTEQEIEDRYQSGQLSSTGRIIALALRRYGAFDVDNGGDDRLVFYGQNFSDTSGSHNAEQGNWFGLLNMNAEGFANDIEMIRGFDFEVIQFEYGKPDTTTTITMSTTTTIANQSCPLELIYGEDSKEIELIRYLRDNLLSQTPEGRKIIRLYYEWSPMIAGIMKKDEGFKKEVEEMMGRILELVIEEE